MKTGFFVDWNGDIRKTDETCQIIDESFKKVNVCDIEGCIIYEAVFYPSIDELLRTLQAD